MKRKIITFPINEEDTERVESVRVYNVKIPLKQIIREILPELEEIFKKECMNYGDFERNSDMVRGVEKFLNHFKKIE